MSNSPGTSCRPNRPHFGCSSHNPIEFAPHACRKWQMAMSRIYAGMLRNTVGIVAAVAWSRPMLRGSEVWPCMSCQKYIFSLNCELNWLELVLGWAMASGINIYSQLLISLIRIVDISISNYWYQQFELLISVIRITDINNARKMLISTIRIVDINNSNCWYQ